MTKYLIVVASPSLIAINPRNIYTKFKANPYNCLGEKVEKVKQFTTTKDTVIARVSLTQ